MTFDLLTLFLVGVAYLGLLFVIAFAVDRRWFPRAVVRHPVFYVLALGVYATTWSYYGSVGFADEHGLIFATIYLGVTAAFLLTPVLLAPLLRLTSNQQLTSVADVFAFRFSSQFAGVLVTAIMLAGILPYIALQIRAVAESTLVLTGGGHDPRPLALAFCLIVTVFAIIFGARHVTPRVKHTGLVVAIGLESLVKLGALLMVAWVAVDLAFDGPAGLSAWLREQPQQTDDFYQPALEGPWLSLLTLTFAAAFLLPRQFHILFTENLSPRSLTRASWAFPLMLLLLALAVPPILWSGTALDAGTAPDYYVLGLAALSGSEPLTLLVYLGGISAATAMIVVSTLALSSMTLNHLVMPLIKSLPHQEPDLYATLRWTRRFLITLLIVFGFTFYELLDRTEALVEWGLMSFLAMAQFLPGIIGVLYWQRATVYGFVAGLLGGALIWLDTVLLPALAGTEPFFLLGFPQARESATELYGIATFWSLALNGLLFVGVSLFTPQRSAERQAAEVCRDQTAAVAPGTLQAASPSQFVVQLAPVTGEEAARQEVSQALHDLGLQWSENRPDRLRALRDQVERNLSGMMGPMLARMIVDKRLQLDRTARTALTHNIRQIEERLESSRNRFRGLAAELDRLRRYHRQILEDLPLGVVAVTTHGRVVRWNTAMQGLSGIPANTALGSRICDLQAPWDYLLDRFLTIEQPQHQEQIPQSGGEQRWLSLHKTCIRESGRGRTGDTLMIIEDITHIRRLERELAHSERLASIGRLAAGVAHEIGNPVTGIDSLAQNLRGESDPEILRESVDEILEQTRRINNIVQTLIGYAHAGCADERTPDPVPLSEVVEEARRLVQLSKRGQDLEIDNQLWAELQVRGDRQRLAQVFVNLFSNTADACGPGGRIAISARRYGDRVQIRVVDNGPGIPAELLDKVIEPFYTTKAVGQGTGLGLPLVYNIVSEQGGEFSITADSGGTTAWITLPVLDAAPPAEHAATKEE
ncbi:MAG: PAS domain-containing protein [Halorhodospira halophila]|uniref:ATP-binding protein n=1 Tax=Halorhodospira TaxID=85108 RepID=UPI001914D460|nr:sensor histidine kinase [Halorhodospira halophila]MCG5532692.1 ATP-binding protein [Halorhodospira sp. 9621]MCG5537718.1 ATP-binding protein [Halorhodospira sp. 9622]MCG5542455.1 ATP-binding protein [Halorhodospira sp. 9628]MBK5937301.1 histidine kinase [Halorhodospira halophila]MCC3751252.1 PAS domain-containing protein [Halorhodospira halophila]